MENDQKLKVDLSYDPAIPLLDIWSKNSSSCSVDTCSAIFIVILLKNLGNEQKFLHIIQLMAHNKIVVYNRILVTCKENDISSFSDIRNYYID